MSCRERINFCRCRVCSTRLQPSRINHRDKQGDVQWPRPLNIVPDGNHLRISNHSFVGVTNVMRRKRFFLTSSTRLIPVPNVAQPSTSPSVPTRQAEETPRPVNCETVLSCSITTKYSSWLLTLLPPRDSREAVCSTGYQFISVWWAIRQNAESEPAAPKRSLITEYPLPNME